jgi:hypothetical protein
MVWAPLLSASKYIVAGTAAAIGKDLILVSDVYFFKALRDFVDGVADADVLYDRNTLRRATQRVLFEEMVQAEMKSLGIIPGQKQDIESRLQKRKSKDPAGYNSLLNRFGKSHALAVNSLWKSEEVERFLQKKVETFTPIITDTEVKRYFDQSQTRFGSDALESQKENIRTVLQRQRIEKSFEEWIRFLKEKYGAVNYLGGG